MLTSVARSVAGRLAGHDGDGRHHRHVHSVRAPVRRPESRAVLDRRSDAWRDAIGPGYVTGVTQGVLDLISRQDSER
jgi:hypothetical protein